MGKFELQALETTIQEAFAGAILHRQEMGLSGKPGKKMRVMKRGRFKGQEVPADASGALLKYRVTTYLEPWYYADLLRLRESLGFRGGVTSLIKKLIRDACPPRLRHMAPPRVRKDAGLSIAERRERRVA